MISIKKELWELLFNSIDEGFCIIQMIFDEKKKPVDYRFLVINSSFERQTGMKDAAGKRMREFAPDHEEHWFEIYGKIALTGESIRFENRAEQLNRWYDVYAFRFGEPQDMQVAILFNDITERKKAEETISSLNKELARNLQRLEFANKELESFSYSVSHDLRAPLRAIDGYAQMLTEDLSDKLSGDTKRYLDSISQSAQKMSYLIDDLLAFSRLARTEMRKHKVDTMELVKNTIDELSTQQNIDKNIFKVGELLPTTGDPALLKQVWVNLISNAYKYSHKKDAPVVEIGCQKSEEGVTYHVKDNGIGFDMTYYDKLFGVFQRLHSEKDFEGTGVGLAIVQRIVHQHGGKVWGEAKVGEGATFFFTVPA